MAAGTYRLLALDLDGTIVDAEGKIPEPVAQGLNRLRNRGIRVVVATGRSYPSTLPFARILPPDTPLIVCNGALVRQGEETWYEYRLGPEALRIPLSFMAQEDIAAFFITADRIYVNRPDPQVQALSKALALEFPVLPDWRDAERMELLGISFMMPAEKRPRLYGALRQHLNGHFGLTLSGEVFIDLLHPRSSKGQAVAAIARRWSVSRQQVCAVGDGLNDVDMIEYAGLGVAVANAVPELKKVARRITRRENHLGTLELIHYLETGEEECWRSA